ncbi:unnamed protein product [Peniophora sp. CBMAI 1063]|nr:unnamed protein product [Peniophora sp. CBMAI 1063]
MTTHALNADILLHVFHEAASNEPPRFMPISQLAHPKARKKLNLPDHPLEERLGWVRYGHVNRAWRDALLNAHTLWAGSIGSLPAGVDEMLVRAGRTAPLSLHLPIWTVKSPTIKHLATVLKDRGDVIRERLRSVTLWDPCPVAADMSSFRVGNKKKDMAWQGEVAALLKILPSIHNNGNTLGIFPFSILGSIIFGAAESPMLETLDLFCHRSILKPLGTVLAPNLRHLRLGGCSVRFPKSNSLVSISISKSSQRGYETSRWMSWEQLVELLTCCVTSLQYLELGDAVIGLPWPSNNNAPYPEAPIIELPALRMVKVQETAPFIGQFLSYLRYPQTTSTCLTILGPQLEFHMGPAIRAILAKHPNCRVAGMHVRRIAEGPEILDLYNLLSDASADSVHPDTSPILTVSLKTNVLMDMIGGWSPVDDVKQELVAAGVTVRALKAGIKPDPNGP